MKLTLPYLLCGNGGEPGKHFPSTDSSRLSIVTRISCSSQLVAGGQCVAMRKHLPWLTCTLPASQEWDCQTHTHTQRLATKPEFQINNRISISLGISLSHTMLSPNNILHFPSNFPQRGFPPSSRLLEVTYMPASCGCLFSGQSLSTCSPAFHRPAPAQANQPAPVLPVSVWLLLLWCLSPSLGGQGTFPRTHESELSLLYISFL